MSKLFEQLVKTRGIDENFLHPEYEKLTDPLELPDMAKAIVHKISQKNCMLILSPQFKTKFYSVLLPERLEHTAPLHLRFSINFEISRVVSTHSPALQRLKFLILRQALPSPVRFYHNYFFI